MRWHRRRLARRVARAKRLHQLEQALMAEWEKMAQLERQLQPQLVTELEPEPSPQMLTPGRPERSLKVMGLVEEDLIPEELEPMPDPTLEIAQRIGLPPRLT